MFLITLLLAQCAAGIGNSLPSLPVDDVAAAVDAVEPLDFDAARRAAAASLQSGSSKEEAVEMAERVLQGEAMWSEVRGPGGVTWMEAPGWIPEDKASLLQHEIVTTGGWRVPDEKSPGYLRLDAPLPPWAAALATRLAPVLDGEPDCCALHACLPGQDAPILEEQGRPCAAAVLSLGSDAALVSRTAADLEHTTALASRSVLLVGPTLNDEDLLHRVRASGGSRLLALTFWRAGGAKGRSA